MPEFWPSHTATGQDPIGLDPIGQDTIGLDPIGLDPIGLDPIGLDPIGQDPIGLDSMTFSSHCNNCLIKLESRDLVQLVVNLQKKVKIIAGATEPYSGKAASPEIHNYIIHWNTHTQAQSNMQYYLALKRQYTVADHLYTVIDIKHRTTLTRRVWGRLLQSGESEEDSSNQERMRNNTPPIRMMINQHLHIDLDLLITSNIYHQYTLHHSTVSFPTKPFIIVIYRPPGTPDHFIDELDILLSYFPIEGNPLVLLGDFNLPSDKLHSSCILPLLTAFNLTLNHSPPTHSVLDLIFTRTTTTSDINEILQLLTSSNPTTCLLDPIPSALFQTIATDLLPFISVIINNSSSGYVPTAFKTARVVPILKKATLDSSNITNYRPNQLHDPNQSGYKPAHSTETAFIVAWCDWLCLEMVSVLSGGTVLSGDMERIHIQTV
ncbi:hypothetical protein P4O66_002675 [Electrophorus voltai]|uniref:Endonuclease/exonuclease/phosphatase domain-containing protein n=1 Tax=Electrophorus voltai TaxID=2609070 RepID=A0AAD9DQY2_9TELE|nr:hypothetical protein P4O66_002675 [Electrophorus voltai]